MPNDYTLKATHQGTLVIGDKELPCAVLEDGTRILTQTSVFRAFGRPRKGKDWRTDLPAFLDAKNLSHYIDNLNEKDLLRPVEYLTKTGKIGSGYKAELLPLICDVYLQGRKDGILIKSQQALAEASEILVRSLSKIGIVALVDEATGYQADRQKDALQKILSAYISEELLPWQKRFPNEFYEQISRLRGWDFNPLTQKRPQIIGKITNEIVYGLLPTGVLHELRKKNPLNDSGHRTHKHHQFLTIDIGNPNLEKHLAQLIILMRISKDWDDFEGKMIDAFPQYMKSVQIKMFGNVIPDEDQKAISEDQFKKIIKQAVQSQKKSLNI